ncbi:hypothetical protein HELRODRAFT_174306 [Helobdella robusta]|uniref:Uncharacterized protein n=1 Tax=Helobdella robusta TaxID=6412 RepID=T1F7Z3_HELRO|nr:hypothetical protein HELRODRAFT_174306 [Helobdella robusta]ESO02869.1 hypothetical protein HELRODRAFT_174306 [Helobdella robusta]
MQQSQENSMVNSIKSRGKVKSKKKTLKMCVPEPFAHLDSLRILRMVKSEESPKADLTSDFSIQINDRENHISSSFTELIATYGLVQIVDSPNHGSKNILDLSKFKANNMWFRLISLKAVEIFELFTAISFLLWINTSFKTGVSPGTEVGNFERLVLACLFGHLSAHRLLPRFQSAYRPRSSTETALLKVFDEIINEVNNGREVLMASLTSFQRLTKLTMTSFPLNVYYNATTQTTPVTKLRRKIIVFLK